MTPENNNRRRITPMEMVSIIMLLLQFAALIWGASALKSSVDGLQSGVVGLSATVQELQRSTNVLNVEVGILKDRVKKEP